MANNSDPIVVAKGVHKTYDSGKGVIVHALRDVELTVQRAEVVGIMGPSGCGKTTLLNCLSGIDNVDEGDISIDGVHLEGMDDDTRTDHRAREMGFIFQLYNLLPVLSSAENVELPMLVSGVSSREARSRAVNALDLVGLAEWAAHRPAELSGGQRQRVTIARALVNDPSIVWADEPTGDLDSETAQEIMDLILRLNEQNRQTFIIVTHAQEIGDQCCRIVRMRDGLIVDDGTGQ
ncbi:MAG: ABC transporter ATP-binding protein [SAR202 cluster bacterium]|jgi:putative ABC transport system ATP-binding protein|nr:ABC transporter ATP-binding protein [SAR202 cluster bacterium]MDP7414647.1 ABC transporter ATP-binding protein [SAR202 cluster bacterium]